MVWYQMCAPDGHLMPHGANITTNNGYQNEVEKEVTCLLEMHLLLVMVWICKLLFIYDTKRTY